MSWTIIEKLSPGSWRAKAVSPRSLRNVRASSPTHVTRVVNVSPGDCRKMEMTVLSWELRDPNNLKELRVTQSEVKCGDCVYRCTSGYTKLKGPSICIERAKVFTPKWPPSQAVGTKRILLLSAVSLSYHLSSRLYETKSSVCVFTCLDACLRSKFFERHWLG